MLILFGEDFDEQENADALEDAMVAVSKRFPAAKQKRVWCVAEQGWRKAYLEIFDGAGKGPVAIIVNDGDEPPEPNAFLEFFDDDRT
jgi:hypothetical protein